MTARSEQRGGGDGAPPPSFEDAVLARLDRILAAVERIADRLDPPKGE